MSSLHEISIDLDGIGHALSDNSLAVPRYQRSYAWEEQHITDLFKDINTALSQGESEYFLGSIVVIQGSEGRLEVVDGQQRLATTTILIAAIRGYFYSIGDADRASDISAKFLVTRNLRTQEYIPKLRLNEVDHEFYMKRVLSQPNSVDRAIEPARESHRRLAEAARHAVKHVQSVASMRSSPTEALLDWIEYLEQRVKIIWVLVPDHANAFAIFETLNDRGLALAISDLLKNHLFSLAQERVGEVQQRWIATNAIFEAMDNEEIAIIFIRHLWSSVHGITREKELYNRIKMRITSKQAALDFADNLERNARLYAAIMNPLHEFWNPYGPTSREHLMTIALLNVVQLRPLLLAILDKLPVSEVQQSLKLLVSMSVRFLITGRLGSGPLETHYSSHAVSVRNETIHTAAELAKAMQDVVPNDSEFRASFSTASVNKPHLARYYLRTLESQAAGPTGEILPPTADQSKLNLEHILPQRPSAAWNSVDSDTAKGYVNRIGNLALLESHLNVAAGNDSFLRKISLYSQSGLRLTAELASYSTWGPQEVEQRQQKLADLAVAAWPYRRRNS